MKKYLIATVCLLFLLASSALSSKVAYANSVYFTSSPSFYVDAGSEYTYHIVAKSTANLSISYAFQSLPGWLSFNAQTDVLSGSTNDAGKYTIYITARDSAGNTDVQNYFLYVLAPNPTTATPTPTATPVPTTITPTQTSISTKTPTPTATKTQVTATVPTLTITPTATPTAIGANTINISNEQPADKSSIGTTSPTVSATITSGFAIDKTNLQIFFDNLDVTSKTNITSSQNVNYQTQFTYKPTNVAAGQVHNVNVIITNPDGIPITQGWSFMVGGSNNSLTKSVKGFFSSQATGIILTVVGLLLFFIIIAKLATRRTQLQAEEKKAS